MSMGEDLVRRVDPTPAYEGLGETARSLGAAKCSRYGGALGAGVGRVELE